MGLACLCIYPKCLPFANHVQAFDRCSLCLSQKPCRNLAAEEIEPPNVSTLPKATGLKASFSKDIALPCLHGKTSTSGDVQRGPRSAGSISKLGAGEWRACGSRAAAQREFGEHTEIIDCLSKTLRILFLAFLSYLLTLFIQQCSCSVYKTSAQPFGEVWGLVLSH